MPKVVIRRFEFSSVKEAGWLDLRAEMKRRGIHAMEALGDSSELPADGATFTAKTDSRGIHSNQFATEEGTRLFDCRILAEFSQYGKRLARRRGYILEADSGFAEIEAVRAATLVCGYCGARHVAAEQEGPGPHWCDRCTGSRYLKPDDLSLLELLPLSLYMPKRATVAPEWLAKEYRAKQRDTSICEFEKAKARKIEAIEKKIADGKLEIALLNLLSDAGLPWRHLDNLIHYSTGKFVFGWRVDLTEADRAEIQAVLNSAPHKFSGFNIQVGK